MYLMKANPNKSNILYYISVIKIKLPLTNSVCSQIQTLVVTLPNEQMGG